MTPDIVRREAVKLLERLRRSALTATRRPLLRDVVGGSVLNTAPGREAWYALSTTIYYETTLFSAVPEWVSAIDRAIEAVRKSDG